MKLIKFVIAVFLFAVALQVLSRDAFSQTTTKRTLTLVGAEQIIASAKAEAKKINAPGGVIAVVDDGGNLMALERLDGTFAAGANISIGKARTAALFKKPTSAFEQIIHDGRTSMVALNDFTPLQGGVPVKMGEEIVGAVGVSGAASASQDEQLAIAGANAFTQAKAATGSIQYFPANAVEAAFGKGAVLLDGSDGRNYMVHASRRDKAGMAEVHTRDADVIHVLEGNATFVTGGSVEQPKSVADDEIRGAAIDGGETRTIAKGDVIVVPAGVPHWFKQVSEPFLYYVVKVR
jgi:glc operon protein GlcG